MALQLPNFQPLTFQDANPLLTALGATGEVAGQGLKNYLGIQQAKYAPKVAQSEAFLKEQQARGYQAESLIKYLQSPAVALAYALNIGGARDKINPLIEQASDLLGGSTVGVPGKPAEEFTSGEKAAAMTPAPQSDGGVLNTLGSTGYDILRWLHSTGKNTADAIAQGAQQAKQERAANKPKQYYIPPNQKTGKVEYIRTKMDGDKEYGQRRDGGWDEI